MSVGGERLSRSVLWSALVRYGFKRLVGRLCLWFVMLTKIIFVN